MAKSSQVLSNSGIVPAVKPGTRVRIDPGLKTASGNILAPDEITIVGPFEVVSIQDDPLIESEYGTFDVQSKGSGALDLPWIAVNQNFLQKMPFKRQQAGVGPRGSLVSPRAPRASGGKRLVSKNATHLLLTQQEVDNTVLIADSTDAPVVLALPADPLPGTYFNAKNHGNNGTTFDGNGKVIRDVMPGAKSFSLNHDGDNASFFYTGELWEVIEQSLRTPAPSHQKPARNS